MNRLSIINFGVVPQKNQQRSSKKQNGDKSPKVILPVYIKETAQIKSPTERKMFSLDNGKMTQIDLTEAEFIDYTRRGIKIHTTKPAKIEGMADLSEKRQTLSTTRVKHNNLETENRKITNKNDDKVIIGQAQHNNSPQRQNSKIIIGKADLD